MNTSRVSSKIQGVTSTLEDATRKEETQLQPVQEPAFYDPPTWPDLEYQSGIVAPPTIPRTKERDNFTLIAELVLKKSKRSFNLLIELELSIKHLSFVDFLTQHQHDIYHLCYNTKRCCQCSSAYKLPVHKILNKHHCDSLFNTKKRLACHGKGTPIMSSTDCCRPVKKNITTEVLDLILSKVLLLHFCKDVFWHSCLTQEDKTLNTFLDQSKHLIYHLRKSDTICCQCSKEQTYNFPRSSQLLIEEDQWDQLFKDKQDGCLQHIYHGKFANTICAVKANPDIRITDISDDLQEIILKKCCKLRKTVDILDRNMNNAYTHATKGEISDVNYKRYCVDIERCIMEIGKVCGFVENEKQYSNDLSENISQFPDESLSVELQLQMLGMFQKESTFQTKYDFELRKEVEVPVNRRSSSIQDMSSTNNHGYSGTGLKVSKEIEKDLRCESCLYRGIAEAWCNDCEHFICRTCIHFHEQIRMWKNHKVTSIKEIQAYKRIQRINFWCEKHNKLFNMFCLSHGTPFCNMCDHTACKIEKLERHAIGIKQSDRFERIQLSNEKLTHNLECFCIKVKNEIDSIPYKKKTFRTEIKKSRETISELLTDMETQCLDDISKHKDIMKASYTRLILCMEQLQKNKADISSLKSYATDLHTCIGLVDVENTYKRCDNSFRKESDVATIDPKWTFTTDKMKNVFFNMGVSVIQPPSIEKEVSEVNIENVNLKRRNDIEIIIPKAAKDTVICGCALLHNGGMCFTDRDNNRILFHNPYGQFLYERTLDCSPIDVICISESKIAISLSKRKSIVLMDVTEGATLVEEYIFKESPGKFGGMALYNKEIIVRVVGFGYYIINTKGVIVSKIENKEIHMPYIACSNDQIYITKWDVCKVFCCKSTGEEIWTISMEDLLNPPNGIAADENGNVFVTGSFSNNVVFITSDGKDFKEVIGGSDLQHPIAISYDVQTKCLLICCSSGQAFVYSVKM